MVHYGENELELWHLSKWGHKLSGRLSLKMAYLLALTPTWYALKSLNGYHFKSKLVRLSTVHNNCLHHPSWMSVTTQRSTAGIQARVTNDLCITAVIDCICGQRGALSGGT